MGIFRKLLKPLTKESEEFIYQAKAIIKQDKISRGEKVLAPKHPTDEVHFQEAQKNEKIREEVARRRDDVISNVNKMTIKSFDPPERPKSNRPLPTIETELMRSDTVEYEYGFYEPSVEKMESGKLMLKEVMEFLHAKTEIDLEGPNIENAKTVLVNHPATSRITAEDIDSLYHYYRPFVRKDTQTVVRKMDLQLLSDYMNNRGEYDFDARMLEVGGPGQHLESMKKSLQQKYESLDDDEKGEIMKQIAGRRMEERKRLEERLNEFNEFDAKKEADEKKSSKK